MSAVAGCQMAAQGGVSYVHVILWATSVNAIITILLLSKIHVYVVVQFYS